jgi:NADH-quinone oxidoreductase subunit D
MYKRRHVTFRARTVNIGTLGKEEMTRLGATGPTARSAGITRDIRVDRPYSGFDIYPINMILDDHGDLNARFVVRLKECFESIRYIRDVLEKIPEGELSVKFPRKIPAGESMSSVEAPRGELFYFVRSNGQKIQTVSKFEQQVFVIGGQLYPQSQKGIN